MEKSLLVEVTVIQLLKQFSTCSLPCSQEPAPSPVESGLYYHYTLFNIVPC
jgi:hypothetical protein